MQLADAIAVSPVRAVGGVLRVPGDKSISHRYALLSAIADGQSTITNYAPGADCASTLGSVHALGAIVSRTSPSRDTDPPAVVIQGRGVRGLIAPPGPLDCGNSGSTMRMLSGVLAAHPFAATLIGDASLTRRPMRRIIAPLTRMGAVFQAAEGDRPPLVIRGADLVGITFEQEVPSAQVKSAVLLAGLQARGETRVVEPASTRDHTERALAAFGASVEVRGRAIALAGGQRLTGANLRVPGDISSAAFFAIAAAALAGSDVTIAHVGLNPTRAALLDVLRRAGADVEQSVEDEWNGEPVGRLRVRHRGLTDVVIAPDEVPEIIDELPVLGALGTFGGSITVSGAGELRVKESDRIAELVAGLRAMGADADERPDGFQIRATRQLRGGTVNAHGDHRLAMAFAIAALGASGPTLIEGADVVAVSYPSFFEDLGGSVKADKIYLVGFMGAGKSTVARALGKRLDWKVDDVDTLIEREERRDIPTIFRQDGEPYFRAKERAVLIGLLPERGAVVASGGGTFSDPANRELMLRDGAVVWLDAPFATVLTRVPLDGRRPLAADRLEMEQLYNQRLAAYRQAHLRVDAGKGSVEELVDHIVEWLGS